MGGKTEFSISVESLRTDYWLHVSTMFKILALQLLIRAAIATAKPFSGLQKLEEKKSEAWHNLFTDSSPIQK